MRSRFREEKRLPPSDHSANIQDPSPVSTRKRARKMTPAMSQIEKAKEESEDSVEQVWQHQETTNVVDDFYFSALFDEDEIFPVSDEKYAEELQFQETLIISCSETLIHSENQIELSSSSSSSMNKSKNKEPLLVEETKTSQQQQPDSYCPICMDTKTSSEMFRNTNVCGHTFCSECIREHVAARIKENLAIVLCPDPRCKGEIGPQVCHSIVPKQVLDRWETVLCESLIMGSEKFYCPFKDCSAMLVDDGGVTVTSSECPHCNRLFCAQCKVAWHAGIDCVEYKSLKTGERDPQDLMFVNLAKDKQWRRCPSCAFYVEKSSGCNHIKCRCGYEFCYGCGKVNTGSHACV